MGPILYFHHSDVQGGVGLTSHTTRIFFPKVIPCLLVIISHYPVSYILGENTPPGEYSLQLEFRCCIGFITMQHWDHHHANSTLHWYHH